MTDRLGLHRISRLEGVEHDVHAVITVGVVARGGDAVLGLNLFVERLVGGALGGIEEQRRPHQAIAGIAGAFEIGRLSGIIDRELGRRESLFEELLGQRDAELTEVKTETSTAGCRS